MEPSTNQTSPAIPIAIILGFALIAIAIFFSGNSSKNTVVQTPPSDEQNSINDGRVPPPTADDYIKGNPNAPIVMIEYSDYECPFCKQFHTTMNQIMEEFGINGQVAWVYRQLPLTQLHPNSALISEAALCVGDIGGNSAFWQFSDRIFADRDISSPVNVTRLPIYAEEAGVSTNDYLTCINSDRMKEKVVASVEEGLSIGARGTPYTVIMVGDQEAVINGAQPYEVVSEIITNLLQQIEGSFVPSAE